MSVPMGDGMDLGDLEDLWDLWYLWESNSI